MAGTRTGTPFRRYLLPVLSVGAIILLCWVLKVLFDLPTTTLQTALPASAGPGTPFSLAAGASFNSQEKIVVGGEQIVCERVTASGDLVNNGRLTRANPNTFRVVERGANGTKVGDHATGAEVRPKGTLFFPENNATFGEKVDDLFYLILWITGIAFILTEGFFLYCVLMFWGKPGEKSFYTHGNHKLEMTWTIVPAVILVALGIIQSGMWSEMKLDNPQPGDPGVITVQVVAKQYEWNFRHAGLDGRFGTLDDIPATGELVVPVGRKVRLEMRSQDVIHSFFLPHFRVKQDVVPGLAIPTWFEAINPGTFKIMCAELCGASHYTMDGFLKVKTAAEYDTWMKAESEKWKGENDGQDRKDWYGLQGPKIWWWWDSNPTDTGYSGRRERKRA